MQNTNISDKNAETLHSATIETVLTMYGPKKAFKKNLYSSEDGGGWRAGFTKPTLNDRIIKNRKIEKARRVAKRITRKNGCKCTR